MNENISSDEKSADMDVDSHLVIEESKVDIEKIEEPQTEKTSKKDKFSKRWQCTVCTFVNSSRHRRCLVCTFDSYLLPQFNDGSAIDDDSRRDEDKIENTFNNNSAATSHNESEKNSMDEGSEEDVNTGSKNKEEEIWFCAACTYKNKQKNKYCELCGFKNYSMKSSEKTPKASQSISSSHSSVDASSNSNLVTRPSANEKRRRGNSRTETELMKKEDKTSTIEPEATLTSVPAEEEMRSKSEVNVEVKLEEHHVIAEQEAREDANPHTADTTINDAPISDDSTSNQPIENKDPSETEAMNTNSNSHLNACPMCTYNNPREFRYCDMCGTQLEQVNFRGLKSPSKVRRSATAAPPKREKLVDEDNSGTVATSSASSADAAGNAPAISRKRRDRGISDYKSPANKRRRQQKVSSSLLGQEVKATVKRHNEEKDHSAMPDDSSASVAGGRQQSTAPRSPHKPSSSSRSTKEKPDSSSSSSSKTSQVLASPTKSSAKQVSSGQRRTAATPMSDSLLHLYANIPKFSREGQSTPNTGVKQTNKSPRAPQSSTATSSGHPLSAQQLANNKAEKVARAERAAEMQAIYDLTFHDPPPLKRGMVIVWDCGGCQTQNAIRELFCLQCNAGQVNRYRYVALCTHYKALEGRRLKRLSDQEGDVPAGEYSEAQVPMHSPTHASSGVQRQKAGSGSSRSAAQSQARRNNDTNDNLQEAKTRPRRGGRAAGEPRKPRIPIISQYPHKLPKLGSDYQIDIDKLPNPAHFIKSKLDYSLYFDRLQEDQVCLDEISPWEYNNAYYEVLWMATDHFNQHDQRHAIGLCPFGGERVPVIAQQEDDATTPSTLPPSIPKHILENADDKDATTTAAAAASVTNSGDVGVPVIEQATASSTAASTAMDIVEDANHQPSIESIAPESTSPKAETAKADADADADADAETTVADTALAAATSDAVVSSIVAEMVSDVLEKSTKRATDADMISTSFVIVAPNLNSHLKQQSSSTPFDASRDDGNPSSGVCGTWSTEDNLLRDMTPVALATEYPVLALRSLYQHRYDIDSVYSTIAAMVLQQHQYRPVLHQQSKTAVPPQTSSTTTTTTDPAETGAFDSTSNPMQTNPQRRFYIGPVDTPLLELSAVDRHRFQQALIHHGNDEWNAVARELDYDFTVGQLQDYYYGTWTTKYRSLSHETEKLHRNYKRAASTKRPRRMANTSRELNNLLLDQERSSFLASFGGRSSSKNRDQRRMEDISIVQHDKDRVDKEEEDEEDDDEEEGEEDVDEAVRPSVVGGDDLRDVRDNDDEEEEEEEEEEPVVKRPRLLSREEEEEEEEEEENEDVLDNDEVDEGDYQSERDTNTMEEEDDDEEENDDVVEDDEDEDEEESDDEIEEEGEVDEDGDDGDMDMDENTTEQVDGPVEEGEVGDDEPDDDDAIGASENSDTMDVDQ